MAETAESAAKKIRDAETKIQETTTELRALEQAPAKAGGKEASSSLHVTLTEVAGAVSKNSGTALNERSAGRAATSERMILPV